MASYHVFVEGAADGSPAGLDRLANAIAAHYQLPAAELKARLARGRLCVKSNAPREVAERYVRDLSALGARCTIEDASAPRARASTPPAGGSAPRARASTPPAGGSAPPPRASTPPVGASAPPARASTPPAGASTLPPRAGGSALPPRAPTPPPVASALPPRAPTPPPVAGYQSGLAAAFSGEMPAASLGALERADSMLSLASVDGAEEPSRPAPGAFAPPEVPASPAAATAPRPARPKDDPVDLFAPPDAADDDLQLDLASDEVERSASRRASTPPPTAPVEPAARISQPLPVGDAPAMRRSQPIPIQGVTTAAASRGLRDPRIRFAAGVLLAILLGFVPAHLIARLREKSAYGAIAAKVTSVQREADTPEAYSTLDTFRAAQLRLEEGKRQNIAILALLIWAAAGGGIAYVWFRRVPWDRLEA